MKHKKRDIVCTSSVIPLRFLSKWMVFILEQKAHLAGSIIWSFPSMLPLIVLAHNKRQLQKRSHFSTFNCKSGHRGKTLNRIAKLVAANSTMRPAQIDGNTRGASNRSIFLRFEHPLSKRPKRACLVDMVFPARISCPSIRIPRKRNLCVAFKSMELAFRHIRDPPSNFMVRASWTCRFGPSVIYTRSDATNFPFRPKKSRVNDIRATFLGAFCETTKVYARPC